MSAGGDGAGGMAVDAGGMPTVFEARSDFEAQCVRGVLGDAGIRSVTVPTGQGIFGYPLRAGSRTVPVRVLPEDLSRARQALAEARWTGKSVDWDEVDVGEMPPEVARALYEDVVRALRADGLEVATGEFQADMRVHFINNGPVTILLDSRKAF